MKILTFVFSLFLFTQAFSQEIELVDENTTVKKNVSSTIKHAIGMDYNLWFDMIKIGIGSSETNTKMQSYGTGFNYEYSSYGTSSGWGFIAGYAQGIGIVGTSTGLFYEKRAPWTLLRVGARAFTRLTPSVDLGFLLLASSRNLSWPATNAYQLVSSTNPMFGYLVDFRYKLNSNFEFTQAFGLFTMDNALAWKIGFNYFL